MYNIKRLLSTSTDFLHHQISLYVNYLGEFSYLKSLRITFKNELGEQVWQNKVKLLPTSPEHALGQEAC